MNCSSTLRFRLPVGFLVLLCCGMQSTCAADEWIDLFDGKTLKGWTPRGDADLNVTDGELHIQADKNVWVVHETKMSDFVLEAEVKIAAGKKVNSGIAFRCQGDSGKPKGYQCEIDSTDRALTGGVHAIGTGWVHPKSTEAEHADPFRQQANGSFNRDGWNHFRIICHEDRIRVYTNNVLTTDVRDDLHGSGYFALQNHGGGGTNRFRNVRVREVQGGTYPQTIDLTEQIDRQVVVDREAGQYLGHPSTCLLEDGRTILCVYPKGHGRGALVYKRSTDGGLTWSDRLPTPASWATSREVPTLHRVIDANGKKRIIMWSGLYPARLAVTEDDGANWSELKTVGDWGGIVVMGFVEALRTGQGNYLAMFHDDGRYFSSETSRTKPPTFNLYKTFSTDGGLTWSFPESVFHSSEVNLCEPGCIRSPDGKTLAVLLRENARQRNSHVIFSHDEGKTWTEPRELPLALTGDRHTGKYGADGRLFISFRCRAPKQSAEGRPFEGDWGGWVGTWGDIVNGRDGQYAVRLKDNTKGYDTTYPGVEVLPDDTFVVTTYGHWAQGEEPYILSVRLKLSELDVLAKRQR